MTTQWKSNTDQNCVTLYEDSLHHSAMTFYLLLKFLDFCTADGNLPYGLLGPHSIKSNLSYNICNVFWKSTAKTWKMTVMQ